MTAEDWQAVQLTALLAAVSSLLLLAFALPFSWWLAHWHNRMKPIVLAFIALPLVMPPTVLGFYLLVAFSPNHPFGAMWQSWFGSPLTFSFTGLVLGSMVYSLPFAVQPLYSGFSQFNHQLLAEAKVLHISKSTLWRRVILPACLPAILVSLGLSFAHTLGEFGVVLMIGGSIPGETRVVSIALFEHVESLNFTQAHQLAAVLTGFSFFMLMLLYSSGRKRRVAWNWT
ncbi:molybdate ABC transporter permease subunit [Alteromonas sediminis]|uniref:Molybdenum transport system permease n=1 Tax=Alteromonas sediminis TaxID=2259342 RepID=A0A3N5Y304_9ALTE|nr:molybdate ABC transporter permease subunit [Alteromonas sediminis]RPJ67086.1 molybdate ABC transporter permease subunit [Alteromonas sediminis]